jgi:H+/Cl- antiporter ClcA/CBS domain-containing protein
LKQSTLTNSENRRIAAFTALGIVLGLVGAVVAFLLYRLILLFTNIFFYQRFSFEVVYPSNAHVGNWVLVIPAIGGLIVGLMIKFGSDRIRGHGIPEAMEAVLTNRSQVSPKIAVLKPISAAIAVGTGGPFGAEGPIIQTGGGIGSVIGQMLHLTAGERKILLGCGAAAGMVGIFYTPITAVVLVLELLLFEFRARSLLPVIIAAGVAAGARHYLIGDNLMFPLNESYGSPSVLWLFGVLGIVVGIIAAGFSKALYFAEELFEKLGHIGIDMMWWPAIGGLILGVIARFEPRVLGMGYNTIAEVVHGQIASGEVVRLSIAKSLALWAALGSGTSGGLLAPMLLIGAGTGSVFGSIVHSIAPGAAFNPHVAAIVAMSALFGAAARAPFTAFVFAFELTGDTQAIIPLMIAGATADVSCRFFLKQSIMTERLTRRGLHVPTDYEADPLRQISVGAAMSTAVDAVPRSMPIRDLIAHIDAHDVGFLRQGFPVVDDEGRLFGVVTRSDLAVVTTDAPETAGVTLDDPVDRICSTDLAVTYPDVTLAEALLQMVRRKIGRLPVVARDEERRILGWLSRSDVLQAREGVIENELLRERPITPYFLTVWPRRSSRRVPLTVASQPAQPLQAQSDGVPSVATERGLAADQRLPISGATTNAPGDVAATHAVNTSGGATTPAVSTNGKH